MFSLPRLAPLRRLLIPLGAALLLGGAAPPPAPAPDLPAPDLPQFAHWIDGAGENEPEMQVQAIDGDTFVIRQSVRTDFEAPFLYLIFGSERALLIDSGAGGLKVRPTIEGLIAAWRARHDDAPVHLVVAHSHSHGDHHAGDSEFADRQDTDVVGLAPEEVARFFGISDWPHQIARFDLGGRMLDVIPTPGHEPAHIMVHDARTRLIFSGDMLYPGRLYVPRDKFDVFRASADRLATFALAHPVRALLGAHIEMTTTLGEDYASRAPSHPDEHPLPLAPETIFELQAAVKDAGPTSPVDRHADFIVYPVEPKPAAY